MLKFFFISTVIFLAKEAVAGEEYLEYKVQPHDTITKILHTLSLKPIYGKNGSFAEVLILNPKKQESLGDCIYVGEILRIPKKIVKLEAKMIEPKNKAVNIVKDKKPAKNIELYKEKNLVIVQKSPINTPVNNSPPPPINTQKNIENVIPKTENKPLIISNSSSNKNTNLYPPNNLLIPSNNNLLIPQNNNLANQNKTTQAVDSSLNNPPSQPSKEIFIANHNPAYSNQNTIDLFAPQNKTNIKNDFLYFSKTSLPALPLKTEKYKENNEVLNKILKFSEFSPVTEFEFYPDLKNNCNTSPSCKIWLWEPYSKCCNPNKRYFLYYENSSL